MRTNAKFRQCRRWGFPRVASTRLVVSLIVCGMSHMAYAGDQGQHPTEAQVKAAYLYNFGKFVRWQNPADTNTFDICILGKNPFGSSLAATVTGEQVGGKSIVARDVPGVPETSHCKLLFISRSEEGRLKVVLGAAKKSNILTVSDMPDFVERGGMIGLVNVEGKIRFEVNVASINDAGMTVSSELLKVAVKVVGMNQAKETRR